MMDATEICPAGFHPQLRYLARDGCGDAKFRNRLTVPQPKYYFIDFGISTWIQNENDSHLVTGLSGQDKSAPELSNTKEYDPFKLDVYILGNMFRTELFLVSDARLSPYIHLIMLGSLQKYRGLEFLRILVDQMVSPEPEKRPSAVEALSMFDISAGLRPWRLYARLPPLSQGVIPSILYDSVHIVRQLKAVASRKVRGRLPAR